MYLCSYSEHLPPPRIRFILVLNDIGPIVGIYLDHTGRGKVEYHGIRSRDIQELSLKVLNSVTALMSE